MISERPFKSRINALVILPSPLIIKTLLNKRVQAVLVFTFQV